MSNRESNYELLRMLAGMAVVVLHFNYFPSGGGAMETATGATYDALLFLEALSACAVNVFILISGYFGCRSRQIRAARLIGLLLQTMGLSLAVNVVSAIRNGNFGFRQIVGALIPANYFVILYIALMLLAPFINRLMDALTPRRLDMLVLIVFALFSVYATGVDVLKEATGSPWAGLSSVGLEGSMNGYSIVNFVMVYVIGAWLNRSGQVERFKWPLLCGILLGCVAAVMAWRHVLPDTAWTYCNPIVILEACVVFLIFGKLRLSSSWINAVAPATFTCYLIHGSILGALNDRITAAGSRPTVLLLLAATVLGVYLVSIAVMFVWNRLYRQVGKWLEGRIPPVQVD